MSFVSVSCGMTIDKNKQDGFTHKQGSYQEWELLSSHRHENVGLFPWDDVCDESVRKIQNKAAYHHHHHDQSSAVWCWSTSGGFSSIASWLSVSCLKTGFKCVTDSTLPPPVCSEDPALWQSEVFLLYLDPAMMSPQTWHLWACWICPVTMLTAKLISHFPLASHLLLITGMITFWSQQTLKGQWVSPPWSLVLFFIFLKQHQGFFSNWMMGEGIVFCFFETWQKGNIWAFTCQLNPINVIHVCRFIGLKVTPERMKTDRESSSNDFSPRLSVPNRRLSYEAEASPLTLEPEETQTHSQD